MAYNFATLGIGELHDGLKNRQFSAAELVLHYLSAVESAEPTTKAFITRVPDQARQQAEMLDKKLAQGESLGSLGGLPLAVKDVIITKGIKTTAGSRILEAYVPPYNATVVEKVLAADAVILGKTNCDEFAMGSSGENSAYNEPPTRNPWDKARVPGGSSSGSAAAVAAGECLAALGTDTGGSIRQPAAFCGVVGLKPTYGRVSRHGLIAMTSSLDQAGPITRTVEDAAYLLEVVAGHDERDATSAEEPVPGYVAELRRPVKGLKVGVPKEFFSEGLDGEVRQATLTAIDQLSKLGADIVEVSLPTMPYALAAYYVICPAEVSANLARYDGMRFGSREPGDNLIEVYAQTRGALLGAEVKRRIMLGTYVLSAGYYDAYYKQAQRARLAIQDDFTKVFSQVDILATPTTPTTAFALGAKTQDPLAMYLADVYTVPVNIAGLPAISVPAGFVQGLPVGLQLISRWFDEAAILRLAYAYEQATSWHTMRPKLAT